MKEEKKQKKEDKREIAIKVDGVSKSFRVPHEKHTSLKSAALNAFEKKTYEEFVALKDVSFEIKKGEFFGIIGRNGSGKSTLLKILAGIYMADEGTVDIMGKLSPFLELGVGFNPELTGRENIFLGGAVLGVSKKEIEKNFDKIVAFSELEEFIDMKLKNYSSGMQVRLAFALSIHAHAEILLMDEVLAVGDSNFQAKCLNEFNKYKKAGKTVILVSHDISTIQRYCDRAMLLRNGKVELIGKSEGVGDKYIYQNMSDEEKRLYDEQKNKDGSNVISIGMGGYKLKKAVEIEKVEILDKSGKKKNTFKKGDSISILVRYKKKHKVDDLKVGVSIFDKESVCVVGFNTVFDEKLIVKDNSMLLEIKDTYFKGGNYKVKAGLFYGNGARSMYDFWENAAAFNYKNNSLNVGVIDAKYTWE